MAIKVELLRELGAAVRHGVRGGDAGSVLLRLYVAIRLAHGTR